MEFIDLSRLRTFRQPGRLAPFAELKRMQPLMMTQDLQLVESTDNVALADRYVRASQALVPVRRTATEGSPDGRPGDFPSRVQFEMTSICNAKCQMCPQMNLRRKLVAMDPAKYKSVVDEIDSRGVDGFWLYHFGESLTHPQFRELLSYVSGKRNLGSTWLSTNGILLDRDTIDFVLASGLRILNFSLQSISVENYAKIAPTSPAKEILEHLDLLLDRKHASLGEPPYLRVQIIEQAHTQDEIDLFLEKYYGKCDLISVNMLEHTHLPFNQVGKDLRAHGRRQVCLRLQRFDCIVNSDGTVTVCDNAYNHQLDIGDVWSESLYDIWNGPRRKTLLERNQSGQIWESPLCSSCTDYDL